MVAFWVARLGWALTALALLAGRPIYAAIGLAMMYRHLAVPAVLVVEADPERTPDADHR